MKRVAIGLILLAVAVPVHADDAGFKWATVVFGAGVFADAWTTERGLDSPGFVETNPTLPDRPTDSRLMAQVIIVDGAVYLAARKIGQRHPAAARWILIGAGVVHLLAAANNDRLYDRD